MTLPLALDSLFPMGARNRDWLVPVTLIVAAEMLLWWAAYLRGYAEAPMLRAYGVLGQSVLGLIVAYKLLRLVIGLARKREPQPVRRLITIIRENLPNIVVVLAGLLIVTLGSAAFSALKTALPRAVDFWFDLPLARWEAVFGIHPWQVSHALFGFATPVIDRIYMTFVPVHVIALFSMLLAKPSALKSQALVTLTLSWLLIGVAGAYLLASAGPIFYDRIFGGDTYAPLTAILARDARLTTGVADWLWSSYASDVPIIASGISAMPSMHVGLTFWLVLILRHTRFAALAWVYFALIYVGSVHLGWHYFSDGWVACLAVWLLWKWAPSVVASVSSRAGGYGFPIRDNGSAGRVADLAAEQQAPGKHQSRGHGN